jgi:hypothetical protein
MQVISPLSCLTPRHAVEVLLESFVGQLCYVPPGTNPIAVVEELPPRLQARARNFGALASWRAWTDNVRFWFIAARLCNQHGAPVGVLAMEILFFDTDGLPVAAGEWTLRSDGRWVLRRVIDISDLTRAGGVSASYRLH